MADHESTRTGYTMGYDEDSRQIALRDAPGAVGATAIGFKPLLRYPTSDGSPIVTLGNSRQDERRAVANPPSSGNEGAKDGVMGPDGLTAPGPD